MVAPTPDVVVVKPADKGPVIVMPPAKKGSI
jgi:hypothetical protein